MRGLGSDWGLIEGYLEVKKSFKREDLIFWEKVEEINSSQQSSQEKKSKHHSRSISLLKKQIRTVQSKKHFEKKGSVLQRLHKRLLQAKPRAPKRKAKPAPRKAPAKKTKKQKGGREEAHFGSGNKKTRQLVETLHKELNAEAAKPSPAKAQSKVLLASNSRGREALEAHSSSPQRTATKQLELLIKNDRKRTSQKVSKSPKRTKWPFAKAAKQPNYSKSIASSFHAKPKGKALRRANSKFVSVLEDEKFFARSRGNSQSYSNDARRRKQAKFADSKFAGGGISILNLNEDACKLLDKDFISRENQTAASVQLGPERKPPQARPPGKRGPRGQALLRKIGRKSKSPEEKFKSQETKKLWGRPRGKEAREAAEFCSGKTIDAVTEVVELSKLKERTRLKMVKDIIEQQNDCSFDSSEGPSAEAERAHYESEQLDLRRRRTSVQQHIGSITGGDLEKDLNFLSQHQPRNPTLRGPKQPGQLRSLTENDLLNPRGCDSGHSPGTRAKPGKRKAKAKAWTDKKAKRRRRPARVKIKRSVGGRSFLLERKMNYSRVSFAPTEVG